MSYSGLVQTLSSIENDGEDIEILFSWNITVDWHWGCLMRLVTVFKSRKKKEIMGIFNSVQSNPTQNPIQSNQIQSYPSEVSHILTTLDIFKLQICI